MNRIAAVAALLLGMIAAPCVVNAQSPYDFGDLPDAGPGTGVQDYATLIADNGPAQVVDPLIRLGALVDSEDDGQPGMAADGDDLASLDDDDGVDPADLALVAGGPAQVRVRATNLLGVADAEVCGFIDFNGDGDFDDAGEAASVVIANGTDDQQFVLDFGTVPAAGFAASTYARFRILQQGAVAGVPTCLPTGTGLEGEVEDYPVTIAEPPPLSLGGIAWLDLDNDGALGAGEPGLPGIEMRLFEDSDLDGVEDGAVVATAMTGADGRYVFAMLAEGGYLVAFDLPAGRVSASGTGSPYATPGPYEPAPSPDDDGSGTDDGTRFGTTVRSAPVTLVAGAEPIDDGDLDPDTHLALDFGLVGVLDLALRFDLAAGQSASVAPGDAVDLEATVINQGSSQASQFEVMVTLPTGLVLDDAGWTAAGGAQARRASIAPLGAGAAISLGLRLRADGSAQGALAPLVAEISLARDAAGAVALDVDSTADADPLNDVFVAQGRVDGSGGDEDDHDRQSISVAAFEQPMPQPSVVPAGGPWSLPVLGLAALLLGGWHLRRRVG